MEKTHSSFRDELTVKDIDDIEQRNGIDSRDGEENPGEEPKRSGGTDHGKAEADLSLRAELFCKDYELGKIRQWQVSTELGMLTVQLPGTVKDGERHSYPGMGRMDPMTGERGTLYVTVHIRKTSRLKRYGIPVLALTGVIFLGLGIRAMADPPAEDVPSAPAESAAMTAPEILTGLPETTEMVLQDAGAMVTNPLAAGNTHTIAIREDGTVAAAGANQYGQCDVSQWENICSVAAGNWFTVGLTGDGTVLGTGKEELGRCNVEAWSGISAIAAGDTHTVGLCEDGTVIATGNNWHGQCDVIQWENVAAIAAGGWHTVGLREDHTVVAVGENEKGQCDVSGWRDISAIAAGRYHTLGLREDGTVVSAGWNQNGQCTGLEEWKDIVAIGAGERHSVGLKANGRVVAVGGNTFGQCDVVGWSDIVAIAVGPYHTVGLRADGTVLAAGINENFQCDVESMDHIHLPS